MGALAVLVLGRPLLSLPMSMANVALAPTTLHATTFAILASLGQHEVLRNGTAQTSA